ncbi:hypothetical protein RND81_06G121300 [Saponaria officinalis]|uniref:Bulb-type lectin domain-containing protein n=1 Tax=Saponaria officinalis TaxID=3572 RepID=A0AAW1K8Z6_SAPOF
MQFVSAASDSITTPEILKDPETLISNNSNFKLGFFGPTDSTNRYLGIWFNNKGFDNTLEVVWVANRNSPVKDSTALLKISNDGNLQVIDEQNKIYWSSNVSSNANSSVAQLLDTGVKLTFNKSEYDANTNIQSWKSSNDPSSGRFRVVILPRDLPEFFILDGDRTYWRSGPWNGYLFLGVPNVHSEVSFGFNVDDHIDIVDISYESADQSLLERFVLFYDGILRQKIWEDSSNNWEMFWHSLQSECDVYGKCGVFAVCNLRDSPFVNV